MAQGHSVASAARELGMAATTLFAWLKAEEKESA